MKDLPEFTIAFSKIMRRERENAKLTQRQIATALDGSLSTVYKLEAGTQEPLGSTIYLVAKALNLQFDTFMAMVANEVAYLEDIKKIESKSLTILENSGAD